MNTCTPFSDPAVTYLRGGVVPVKYDHQRCQDMIAMVGRHHEYIATACESARLSALEQHRWRAEYDRLRQADIDSGDLDFERSAIRAQADVIAAILLQKGRVTCEPKLTATGA